MLKLIVLLFVIQLTGIMCQDSSSLNKTRIHERECHRYQSAVYTTQGTNEKETKIDNCGNVFSPLVVGFSYAKPREFPHMALIGYVSSDSENITWACGGTLISERYVITSATCLTVRHITPKFVRIGDLDISVDNEDAQPEEFTIEKTVLHPKYSINSYYDQIGLIKLDRNVELNPYRRPACLPTSFEVTETKAIATGWGKRDFTSPPSKQLKKLVLEIFSHKNCSHAYSEDIRKLKDGIKDETQICTGANIPNVDTCQGDSGGPLQVLHTTEYCMYTIIGITSFGKACGEPGIPSVSTRVFPYIDWIEKEVWECHRYQSGVYITGENGNKIDKCGFLPRPLEVGLSYAKSREFPHMAQIGYIISNAEEIHWSCGGTLISERYVLTSASCITVRNITPKFVRIGDLDVSVENEDAQPELFTIEKKIPHPEHKENSHYNQIGLIKLDRHVEINPYRRPACLPTSFEMTETKAIATGWGKRNRYSQSYSNILKKIILEIFPLSTCSELYKTQIGLEDGIKEDIHICIGSNIPDADTCNGDSGGPLQVYSPTEYCMYTVIGITSFGKTCGETAVPGVSTRIFSYIDWIEKEVWG